MNIYTALAARGADSAVNAELLAATGDDGTGNPRFAEGWPDFPIDKDSLKRVTFFTAVDIEDRAIRRIRVQFDIWTLADPTSALAIDKALLGLLHEKVWFWDVWRIYGEARTSTDYPGPQGEPHRRKRDFQFTASKAE